MYPTPAVVFLAATTLTWVHGTWSPFLHGGSILENMRYLGTIRESKAQPLGQIKLS